jgi:hypothetical protein
MAGAGEAMDKEDKRDVVMVAPYDHEAVEAKPSDYSTSPAKPSLTKPTCRIGASSYSDFLNPGLYDGFKSYANNQKYSPRRKCGFIPGHIET